jgi:hypothetical protein
MYADPHVASLEMKHAHLEDAIADEAHRPIPDTIKITELKREKLRIKEEIGRFVGH